MSLLGNAMSASLTGLATIAGQALQYRATTAGSWVALANAFLQPGPPVLIGYDEQRNAIMAPQNARLKVAIGGTHLLPGIGGAQVKDQNGVVWMVVGVIHAVGQSIYELQRAPAESQGTARGTVP